MENEMKEIMETAEAIVTDNAEVITNELTNDIAETHNGNNFAIGVAAGLGASVIGFLGVKLGAKFVKWVGPKIGTKVEKWKNRKHPKENNEEAIDEAGEEALHEELPNVDEE